MATDMEQVYKEKGDTWPKVLKYNYEKYGDNHRAMRYKHYGIWQPYTWKDYYLNVKYLALAYSLSALSLEISCLLSGIMLPSGIMLSWLPRLTMGLQWECIQI